MKNPCCRVASDDFAVLYPTSFQHSKEIITIRQIASEIDGLFPRFRSVDNLLAGVHPDDAVSVNQTIAEMMEHDGARCFRGRFKLANGESIRLISCGRITQDDEGQSYLSA